MESVRDRYRRLITQGGDSERLQYFSDAVFAIAITLLVIDLPRPVEGEGSAWELIVEAVPGFFAYALSFAIIAINWVGHHRKFRVIEGHDSTLMLINLVLLFLVAFVPFPTSLISEYGSEVPAVALYAFVVGALSAVQLAMWAYARRAGLMSKVVDPELYGYVVRDLLAVPLVFWASILIAVLWSGEIAMYSWFLLFPVSMLVNRIGGRRRAAAAQG